MQRKQASLTLSVHSDTKDRLSQLAQNLGIFWGSKPSPSKLITAIADENIKIGKIEPIASEKISALSDAIKMLQSNGETQKARLLIGLVSDLGISSEAILHKLFEELSQGILAWRTDIEQAIAKQEPVLITYESSKPSASKYLARYIEIYNRKGNWYVEIRTDDGVSSSSDISGLHENRCLRLDKIKKVEPAFHPLGWNSDGLAKITATIELKENSAFFYQTHPDDIPSESIYDENGILRIVRRKVSNGWWFARDITELGPGVVVKEPTELAIQVLNHVQGIANGYEKIRGERHSETTGPMT